MIGYPAVFFVEWVQRLRGLAGPEVIGVLLRGSHARGTATAYSDVDFDVLVGGPPYANYPAYLIEMDGRLTHVSVAIRDAASWLDRLERPATWSYGFPVATAARLLWAHAHWLGRLDLSVIEHPAGGPELEDLVADLGKVAAAALAGDEMGLRLAAADLARLCPSVLRLVNEPVTVACRREALEAALSLPVAPPTYRIDMATCLGLDPRRAAEVAEVAAAASRLVAGTLALVRPCADELVDAVGPDFAAALTDGRLSRYVGQLAAVL